MDSKDTSLEAKPNLLVVDDEDDLLEIFREFLSPDDYVLEMARTGTEAIEKLQESRYDLVVTDLNLPGADGLAVLRKAREQSPQPEVIVLTGNASTLTAIEALRQGAYDYVLKPFDLYEMDQTMRKALERRRLVAENRRFVETLQATNEELRLNQEALRRHQDRLQQEVEAATRRIRTLYEVGKEISASLHLDRTLALILDRSLSLTGGTQGALFLEDESGAFLECRLCRGVEEGSEAWARAVEGLEGHNERVVLTRRPVQEKVVLPGQGNRSALFVPLLQEGEVTGTVVVLRPEEESFSEDDSDLLVSLAAQASNAVHNARAYGKILELERLKSEFVAVVSHEVRTPLTSIKGSLEILGDDKYFEVGKPQKELLEICLSNADRLEALINDILDFSKLESSRLSTKFEPISLGSVIDNVLQQIGSQAGRKGISIQANPEADLPLVAADELRISQVLNNLLSNAIKFSSEETEILVRAALQDGGVVVEIQDQGIGISPEDLPKIFKPFRQLDSSSTRKTGGTGLGLVISRGIVEEHGGRIWAESEPGRGSRFSFWLPCRTDGGSPMEEDSARGEAGRLEPISRMDRDRAN